MRTNKIIFLLILFFLCNKAIADKLEKGFERLKAFDYFTAKEYFEKTLEDEPAAAAFGLSSIFSFNKNPFYNVDSAKKYIMISDSSFKLIKDKTKKKYQELGVTDTSIIRLEAFICEDAFNNFKTINSVSAYNHFLKNFVTCSQSVEATTLRNVAAFNEARFSNTSAAYKDFMALYPTSLQYNDAVVKFEELVYKENTADNSIESYEKFMANYPENSHIPEAEKMIYTISIHDSTLEQYTFYVRKYKETNYTTEAWHEIYRLGMKDFSEETFNRFKINYPDYPFPEELESDFRLQNFFFLPILDQDRWGYINEQGEEMIKPTYEEASLFSNGLAVVMKKSKYGYINKAGKTIINFRFEDGESFHNGSAIVKKDSLYGLINKNGFFLIPTIYQELSEVSEDIFMGVRNDNSGYIRKNGDTLTGFVFDLAGDFKNGYAIVNRKEKFGLLNANGTFNIEPKYAELAFIGNGLIKALTDDETWGILNVNGETILPFEYQAIGEFHEGLALVAKENKFGYINDQGLFIIPMKYLFSSIMLSTGQFQNGFALFKQKFKSVLIDTTGKTISFAGSEDYGRPSAGFIPIRRNKKWGYTDMKGKIIIQCKYEFAESFEKGFAVIKQNKMKGLIDSTGTVFIQPLYEGISVMEKTILVRSGGKSGLLKPDGILLVPCQYDKIEFLSPSIARASDVAGVIYINLDSGKIVYNSASGK